MNPFWAGFLTGVIGLAVVLALPIYVIRRTMLAAISDAEHYKILFEREWERNRTQGVPTLIRVPASEPAQ